MAKGKRTGGGPLFAPGNQISKGYGRPKAPPEVKEMRNMTSMKFTEIADKFYYMSTAEIEAYLSRPETPMLEKVIGLTIIKSVEIKDIARINTILDRTIGKPKEVVENHIRNYDAEFAQYEEEDLLQVLRDAKKREESGQG